LPRCFDLFVTALAPAIWGSTYIVTTEFLPSGYPITLAVLRALPAGLLLLLLTRHLPPRAWLGRIFLLGALNFAVFWTLLFIAAYRLPGGVAATLGALQALWVIFLAAGFLKRPIRLLAVSAALTGAFGVFLLVSAPTDNLDPLGIAAALGSGLSMATGTVLTRKWQVDVPLLSLTAWQLTAGGLLLMPFAFFTEPAFPPLTTESFLGLAYLSVIGAALTYVLWFRAVSKIEPSALSTLGFFSPVTALFLGWFFLDQDLTLLQGGAVVIIFASIAASQRSAARP